MMHDFKRVQARGKCKALGLDVRLRFKFRVFKVRLGFRLGFRVRLGSG